jgi:hypothetical protein
MKIGTTIIVDRVDVPLLREQSQALERVINGTTAHKELDRDLLMGIRELLDTMICDAEDADERVA